jgi:polar amino acid transport system substrate-binding protein
MRAFLACLVVLFTGSLVLAQSVTPEQKAQLAPTGKLRAAVVTIPFLAKQNASGQATGVAADLGAEMARTLGVPYEPSVIKAPPDGVAAVRDGKADVTFLAPTPERIRLIDFAPAFMEMELSLLVMTGSPIQSLADADQAGRRIVVYERSANEEMVRQKLPKATRLLVPLSDQKKAFEMIKAGEADAFADLLYQTAAGQADMPGTRIVPGAIGYNALAIGVGKDKPAAAAYVKAFTETAIKSGLVAKSIEKAGVRGAAPPKM